MKPEIGTVYLIMMPSVKRDGGLPRLESLAEHGRVRVLMNAGEFQYRDPQKCLDLIRQRLDKFDPARDSLVWAGGETLAAVLTGVVLADLSAEREFDTVTWLRYHRPRTETGGRSEVGVYLPVTTSLFPSNELEQTSS